MEPGLGGLLASGQTAQVPGPKVALYEAANPADHMHHDARGPVPLACMSNLRSAFIYRLCVTVRRGMEDHLTALIADTRCESCEGILVVPRMIGGPAVRMDAAFVCVRCNRPYYWVGEPRRLNTRVSVPQPDDD